MKHEWKVGDIAKMTGLTVRTLHFYDEIGLFSPSRQLASGHRLYNEADLARLQQILSLKALGLSLEEVKSAINGGQMRPLDVVRLQIDRLKEQIKQQQRVVEQLEHMSKHMQGDIPLTVTDFTELLHAMKNDFEKPFLERQMSWEQHLDQLGRYFTANNDIKQESKED